MKTFATGFFALCVLATGSGLAYAQDNAWTDRWRVSLNGGVQTTSNDFRQTGAIEEFGEAGSFTVDYRVKGGPQFDGGLTLRIWKQVQVGVAAAFFDKTADSAIEAQIPHPIFPNRFRSVSGTAGLPRRETAVHVLVAVPLPVTERLGVTVSAGPTFFNIEQDVVDDVDYEHQFPFNEATFERPILQRVKENTVGFNAGIDVAWLFTRHVGAGLLVRFSRGNADLRASDRNTVSTDVGGLHTGAGLRLAF